jgi:hypothetical protein
LYLWQAARLKRKLPLPEGFRFPSLELLEKVNARVLPAAMLLIGGGFAAGLMLALVKSGRGHDVRWSDPAIWTTALVLVWLIVAVTFNAAYKPARHGRKTAYLAVFSFVLMSIVLAVFLLADKEHGAARKAEGGRREAEQPFGAMQ